MEKNCGETFMVVLRPEELCSCASTEEKKYIIYKKKPAMATAVAIVYKFMTNLHMQEFTQQQQNTITHLFWTFFILKLVCI